MTTKRKPGRPAWPEGKAPRMVPVRLSPETLAELEEIAPRIGNPSRSVMIRQAIDYWVRNMKAQIEVGRVPI